MTALILVAFATVTISSICSLLEATLYSTRLATLEAAKEEGGRRARRAQRFIELKSDVAAPTSAILILNTIANTAGATVVGVLAVRAFGASALTPVSIGLTLAILFLAEILPKTYAATYWRRLWPGAALLVSGLVAALRPALWFTDAATSVLTRRPKAAVPKGEIQAMIRIGQRSGCLNDTEAEILDATLELSEQRLEDVAVPAGDVVTLDSEATASDAVAQILRSQHTRYPVCGVRLDDCVGLVHAKDLLAAEPDQPLRALVRPIARIPGATALHLALRYMQSTRLHMVLVCDRSGTATRVTTLEDVLEQVVGPVMDEFDSQREEAPEGDGPDRGRAAA